MAKKLYVGALTAQKELPIGVAVVSTVWGSTKPISIREAIRKATETARERWPLENGFSGHKVEVVECPTELLREVCESMS